MKGFTVSSSVAPLAKAAIESGNVTVMITNKEGKYSLQLSALDSTGTIDHTWISRPLLEDEVLNVVFEEIDESSVSEVQSVRDFNDEVNETRLLLESYYRLRDELIQEGVLPIL